MQQMRLGLQGQGLLGDSKGQATVEGAFVIPVLFLAFLLLIQPGILLYDRIVMEAAAADACRMLMTRTADGDVDAESYEEAVRRHLGAIPQQENFHCHEAGCSWRIELSGDEHSEQVSVRIATRVQLLPLLGGGAALLGIADESGCMELAVSRSASVYDDWVASSVLGIDPSAWVRSD